MPSAKSPETRFDDGQRVVTVGLIGCGSVTETRHLPALRRIPHARVVAVADVDPARRDLVADRFRIERRYADAAALLSDPSIEAAAVCVPAELHVEVAIAALDAGKHVLVEKPLATAARDADRLIAHAHTSSAKVMLGFNMRWHRRVREARSIIHRGALGPIEMMRTAFTSHDEAIPEWRMRRDRGGGVLFELAVHHFDLWRHLLDTEVEEIAAVSRSRRWEDETATVMARLANGVPVVSVFSERTSGTNEIEVFGRAGRMRVSCYHFDGLEVLSPASTPGDVPTRLRQAAHFLTELPAGIASMRRGGEFLASYEAEWRHFLDAIRYDAPVGCTLHDGRRALDVILAAIASSTLGRPVKVPPADAAPQRDARGTP
jgi:predicted dehydrogenase